MHYAYMYTRAPCMHVEIEREKCPQWMLVIEHIHELPEANAHIHVFINVCIHTYIYIHNYTRGDMSLTCSGMECSLS